MACLSFFLSWCSSSFPAVQVTFKRARGVDGIAHHRHRAPNGTSRISPCPINGVAPSVPRKVRLAGFNWGSLYGKKSKSAP